MERRKIVLEVDDVSFCKLYALIDKEVESCTKNVNLCRGKDSLLDSLIFWERHLDVFLDFQNQFF